MVDGADTPASETEEFGREYKSVRTLVTGASGFVGRWVASLLSRAGADLVVAVRDPVRMSDIARERDIHGDVIAIDLRDEAAVAELLRKVKPSVTFNLAGYGVDPRETDRRETQTMNCDLPKWLAASLAGSRGDDWGGANLIHAGSALEYGTAGGSLRENGPATPTTVYGRSKLAGTQTMLSVARELGLGATVARLFTVYGPGEHAGRLLPSLIKAAEDRQPIALTTGVQKRDFTFVRDAAEGLLRLGLLGRHNNGVVNVATGRLASVRAFVETAAPILGLPAESLEFGRKRESRPEMNHEPVSVDRLRDLTGWKPTTTIAEGIRITAVERSVAA